MLQSYFRPISLPQNLNTGIGVYLLYIFGSSQGIAQHSPNTPLGGGIGHSTPLLVDPKLGGSVGRPPWGWGPRRSFQKLAKACKGFQKHKYKSMQKLLRGCKRLQNLSKARKSLQKACKKLAKAWRILQKLAKASRGLQKPAKACRSL